MIINGLSVSPGNTKLGRCLVLSRAVGDTCSPTCPMYRLCYARLCEARFAHVRSVGEHNRNPRTEALRALFLYAQRIGKPVRLHERGDFGNGWPHAIDARYVGALERAVDSVSEARVWTYTHVYHARLARLADRGLSIYASIHGRDTYDQARHVGFDRFALVIPFRCKTRRSNLLRLPVYVGPQFLERFGRRFLVCPAQHHRLGRGLTCVRCKYCIKARGDVVFLIH